MARRGAFILLEGVDRCGKSTQVKLLTEKLRAEGKNVESMRFPDRTTSIGSMISNYLKSTLELDDHVIHLLYSANRWEFNESIKKKLNSGTTIICDRYAFSGVAFTAAKGYSVDWCKAPDKGLVKPDVVFFLNLDMAEAEKRGGFGDERYEKTDFQIKVKEIFENQLKDDDWVIIDASRSIEQVSDDLLKKIEKTITEAADKPIETLFE